MTRILIAILATLAAPALADGYARVTDRAAFVGLVGGKSLTSLGVSLTVTPSGSIGGRAFGRDVSGAWTWDDGFFCRTMQAGDRVFARNCQVVERQGDRLRFIADQGQGDTADLRIR
ncbi:MAG: dihydrodipicolinate reductase [Gemmobacter sp.]